jgi:hypothetical protein
MTDPKRRPDTPLATSPEAIFNKAKEERDRRYAEMKKKQQFDLTKAEINKRNAKNR